MVDPVVSKYYPALLQTVHACLAVFGAMALAKRTKPLCLILETPSGYGKSAVLQMMFPVGEKGGAKKALDGYVYRSDKFSPKAFVSHVANVKSHDLSAIDLLPKLKNKVVVTKELAPIFRGREEEMQENFATLISVLDGQGFTSDSGTRGKRGYEESHSVQLAWGNDSRASRNASDDVAAWHEATVLPDLCAKAGAHLRPRAQ